jgi:single-strand DNA-binding protein
MAAGINKVILVGNLGRDPEIQRFDNGVKKATFSLATTEQYRGKDGEKTSHTEWHNIVLWRGLADVAENYLKKGNTVYIEGRIRRREYEDKDGVKKFIFEILGDVMQMLGSGGGGQKREDSGGPQAPEEPFAAPTPDDDLPF